MLSEAKQSLKKAGNTLFHARSGNESLESYSETDSASISGSMPAERIQLLPFLELVLH